MDCILSVIIPIYNVEDYLEQCISSICNQTYSDLQIILVDDGSTDGSGKICDDYAARDCRVKVIHKQNGGVVSARKAGVEIAQGAYITFVDGDDWLDSDTYEHLLMKLKDYAFDIVTFGCIQEYADQSKTVENEVEEGLYAGEVLKQERTSLLLNDREWWLFPRLWNKIIKKELFVDYGNQVPDYVVFAEDAASALPCMVKAESIYFSKATPYHYRQREGSAVKRVEELPKENFMAINTILSQAFEGNRILLKRLRQYMFSLLLLKCYSSFAEIAPLVPFDKVQHGNRVFVYGAGDFGRVIENYVEKCDNLSLVGWTDKRASILREIEPKINSLDDLYRKDYDHIVIAIMNRKVAKKASEELIKSGIPEEKIDWVKSEVLEKINLPEWLVNAENN